MIKKNINRRIEIYKDITNNIDKIEEIASLLTESLINDKKIILGSNSKSSFLMQHFQSLLSCKYRYERPSLPVFNLMNHSLMNDFLCSDLKKEEFLSIQLKDLASKGDVLIYFSSSEEGINVNDIFETALSKDLKMVLFYNQLNKINIMHDDILSFIVKSKNPFKTNEIFLFLFYQILDLVEYQLFSYEE